MTHPHAAHRQHHVEHRRVAHITKGYAHGGAVHGDEAEDKALIKKTVKKSALKVAGDKPKHRADRPRRKAGGPVESEKLSIRRMAPKEGRKEEHEHEQVHELARAKGGRTNRKGGKTVVNVIAGGAHPPMAGGPPPMPMAPPPAAAAPMPAAMPPRPPMMSPAGAMPPGMPPRKAGGRAYASGGAVKDGPTWNEGRKAGTKVQHTDGKNDQAGLHRGKPITYKTGGAVEHPKFGGMAPHLPGGAGGGEARIAKQKRAAHG